MASALAALTLAACATPAEPGRMVPAPPATRERAFSAPLLGGIGLGKVDGGEATEAWSISKVGNAELQEALRLSLARYGLLSSGNATARYRLDAFLVELKQPRSGFNLSVQAYVRYRLTRSADGGLLLDEILDGSHRATPTDSVIATKRLRIANEGAVRRSIAALLGRLEKLSPRDLAAGLSRHFAARGEGGL